MSRGLNKVILIGHLGGDPDIKYTQSGTAVANVSLATTEQWTKDGEKQSKTEWHKIVAWRKLAEIIGQYCKKGQLVYFEGKLTTEKWQKEGVDMFTTKVVVDQMIMLGGGDRDKSDRGLDQPQSQSGDFSEKHQPPEQRGFDGSFADDSDIPF